MMGGTLLLRDMWVQGDERETGVAEWVEELYEPIEAGAFWASIAFPIGYVPFLVDGIGSTERAVAFAALVVVHVLLLTVGHTYER